MEALVNLKTLRNGTNIIQLETHIATPIKFFNDSLIVNIPRSRFLPVKKTTDLMLVMSNIYTLNKGTLTMSKERFNQATPLIELQDEHFKEVCSIFGVELFHFYVVFVHEIVLGEKFF